MPEIVSTATQDTNFFFTCYFVLEMLLKLMGLGPRGYASDNFNLFDALVTLLGVLDMALTLAPNVTSPGALTVFRAFRLLRVFRLARSWRSLNRTVKVLVSSLVSVGWLTALLFLFLFISGLLGMTFFGYKLDSCAVPGAQQLCPPGMTWRDCPSHFDCYIQCNASQIFQWYSLSASPYGGQAYCEAFPRAFNDTGYPVIGPDTQYWAQVGKAVSFMPNFDNIYLAIVSTFIMITSDNWDYNMKNVMVLTNDPWLPAIFTIVTMIIGIYIVSEYTLSFRFGHDSRERGGRKSFAAMFYCFNP